jgi:Uma2 family endonuclease
MTLTIPITAIELSPGSTMSLPQVSWRDFEAALADLGENRCTRLAYYQGTLEIMSPLAIHERPHRIISDIVKTILDAQDRNWEDFGSTTLKRPQRAGIEPDACFYIQNADQVRGCTQLNLQDYPPPDLAIEADVTSTTAICAYVALGVPEVWIYQAGQLKIYILAGETYQQVEISPTFPGLPLLSWIPQWVQRAIEQGTRQMLREVRNQLVNG